MSQDPLKGMFATRIASLACAITETALLVFKLAEGGKEIGKRGLGIKTAGAVPFSQELRQRGEEICKLALGLLGTLVLGIVFSPITNLKLHIWLQLVVDGEAELIQKKRQARMEAEAKKREREEAREACLSRLALPPVPVPVPVPES